jgi:demethylmenaquinone methyltransferase / 2-methoxy-6-polyprenyl-1,4-benzoquinol methylase
MSVSSGTEAESGIPERDSEEFANQVRGMFDRIAGVYDVMNSAMTAGLHHQWRQRAVDRARVGPGSDALDVCCGTGDLALELRRRIGPDGRVVGCDFSEPMLELARRKSGDEGLPVEFGWADALELPYGDGSFDAVTIGFGARNLADLERGIAEMTRVLRPEGRLVILEITRPHREPLSAFYSLWFDKLVPVIGTLAGDADAYSYLPDSVKSFPEPERLAGMLDAAGLTEIRWLLLAGGIIAIHSATKPA